jgi:hypothetical protein
LKYDARRAAYFLRPLFGARRAFDFAHSAKRRSVQNASFATFEFDSTVMHSIRTYERADIGFHWIRFMLQLRRSRSLEAIRTMCRMMQEFFDHAARGVK